MPAEDAALRWMSGKSSHNGVSRGSYAAEFSYGRGMELGYARVSTGKQDLERQIDALTATGVNLERIYLDDKSGAAVDRPGLRAVLGFARRGDVIVVHTLDRLGRTVRDTLNLIHELTERGVGVRNLADPIKVNSADPADPMGQLAVVLLALFAQMERTYTCERAAHARAVAAAHGRQLGRPSLLDPAVLAYAVHLRDAGHSMTQIVAKTGMTRSSLYRYLPPRPPPLLTAAEPTQEGAVAPTADPTRVSVGA
jgi:DNA invertase Pin-like site-specific DNA recombinase